MNSKTVASFGAFSGLLSVVMGAFATHALSGKISEHNLATFHKASEYEIYHALALVLVGICMRVFPQKAHKKLAMAGLFFISGTVFFSFPLYLFALTGLMVFALVAPLGGISLMLGWILLGLAALDEGVTR